MSPFIDNISPIDKPNMKLKKPTKSISEVDSLRTKLVSALKKTKLELFYVGF